MRIYVNSWPVILFPSRLIINNLTLWFVRREFKKSGLTLTRKQTARFVKEFRNCKKSYSGWTLVEIQKKNGKTIKLKP